MLPISFCIRRRLKAGANDVLWQDESARLATGCFEHIKASTCHDVAQQSCSAKDYMKVHGLFATMQIRQVLLVLSLSVV